MAGRVVFGALAVAISWMAASPVRGHGGGPAVEILPTRAPPGGTVLLYGENLDPEAVVTVALATGAGAHVLGRFRSDGEGHLVAEVRLPGGLVPRVYELHVATDTGTAVTSLITIEAAGPTNRAGSPVILASLALAILAAALAGMLSLRHRQRLRPS